MTPDYIFPAINDGSDSSPSLSIYEFAHNLYSDQLYDWILGVILSSSYRNAFESLLYGKDYNSASYVVPSSDLPNVGYSVMRNSNTSYLLLKYGPHGDYHGHYDKGEIILYKVKKIENISFMFQERELIADYGSVSYGLALHTEYMKRTLSHSTIIPDGNCQLEAEGNSNFFTSN